MGFWVEERGLSITQALSITSEAQSPPARRLRARHEAIDGVEWCSMLSEVLMLPDVHLYFSQVLFWGIELSLILFGTLLFTAIDQDFMLAAVVTCRRQTMTLALCRW